MRRDHPCWRYACVEAEERRPNRRSRHPGDGGERGELTFVFGQFAQILEDQARGFRRLVAFFLFFGITDQ